MNKEEEKKQNKLFGSQEKMCINVEIMLGYFIVFSFSLLRLRIVLALRFIFEL